jgi:hypothetical protein
MGLGLIIQRRSHFPHWGGGRNAPEWVAGINRNARPEWIGIGGRNRSESVAGMRRNTQHNCKHPRLILFFPMKSPKNAWSNEFHVFSFGDYCG